MVRIYDEFKSMFITVAFLVYIFLVSGLIVNFLQLCTCVIWPLNKQLYRKINSYLALTIWSRKCFSPRRFLLKHRRSIRIQFFCSMVVEKQLRFVHRSRRFEQSSTRTFDCDVNIFFVRRVLFLIAIV